MLIKYLEAVSRLKVTMQQMGTNIYGSLSSLPSFISRLMIVAHSIRRLSSEAANLYTVSTASPSISAAYTNSAFFRGC